MEVHVSELKDLSRALDNRPVWDNLGEESADDPEIMFSKFYKHKDADCTRGSNSLLWNTTNSEYGRFQKFNNVNDKNAQQVGHIPSRDGVSRSLELLGSAVSKRDPAGSARARAASIEASRTPYGTGGVGKWSSSGMGLPALDIKYMPLRHSRVPDTNEIERRRLTTGFAKSYMRQSHGPLWKNMQTIAEGAGLYMAPDTRQETQVLTIDRPDPTMDNADDNVEYDDELIAKILSEFKTDDAAIQSKPVSAGCTS